MTRLRTWGLALGALLLLLLGGAALFVATFDINRYKPQAIEWMKTERQRTLAIDGPIELSVFPRLAIKVSKVRLSEHARADEFAAVDEASLSLEVMPLLRKRLVVDRVSARGVRAVYTRDARGFRNIDDLLGDQSGAPSTPAPSSTTAPLGFDIGGLTLQDARLVVRDDKLKLAGTVTLASFSSGRVTDRTETALVLKGAQLDLTQPQLLKITLDGTTDLRFDQERKSVSLRNAHLAVAGDTDAVQDLKATLDGALAWDGATLDAGPLALAVASGRAGGVTLGASKLDVKRLVFGSTTKKLELDALKLALAGRQRDDPFELALDWPRLSVAGERLEGSAFSGRVKLDGKATSLDGRFESGAPSGGFEALRLPDFTLRAGGASGARKIDATLKANLLLRPGASAATFERLDLRAAIAEPGLAPLQLALGGQASADPKGAQWQLGGTLNTNKFDSQGSATFAPSAKGALGVQASARFDRLDLNQLLAPAKPAPQAAAPSDTPVDLAGLTGTNGRVSLSAGQLVFRQYKVSDAKLDATLDGGVLRVSRLTGGAWGGNVEASGSADAKSKRIAVKLNATGVDVNALLKDVAAKDLLEGTGRVSADLVTTGASVGALRSNLAGSAALQLRDGSVKGINLARSLRQAKAALTMRQDALTKAQTTEKTDFSELTASALIAGGVATSKDLDVKSPFLRIGGDGRFDIGRSRIDYTARATVTGAPTGQDGAELASLRGLTVPVTLEGPFDAIDWKIQWSGVAQAALEARVKDKLAERLGIVQPGASAPAATSPKEQIKDRLLKGLFGR